jgi:glyoxalase-like protein
MSDLAAAGQSFRPVLDHAVINVMGKLDEAAAQYVRLGFQLTERGHHTLGSSNNLAIFGTNYLELLGYLPGRETMRADLWAHPAGLTGLVFKSPGADLVYATLKERGVPVQEPMSFARPVALPGGAQDARFKVIRVSGDAVQNGRTFFCHHDTPELVYRAEWQTHPNGVTDIGEFVIASKEPARTAAVYDRMFGPDLLKPVRGGVSFQAGAATVLVLEPAAIAERYAGAALVSKDGSDRMVALTFKVASLAKPRALFDEAGIAYKPYAGGIVVSHADAANVALGFTAS